MFYSQDIHKQKEYIRLWHSSNVKTTYFCMTILLNRRTGRNTCRLLDILLLTCMSNVFYSCMEQWIGSPIHWIVHFRKYNNTCIAICISRSQTHNVSPGLPKPAGEKRGVRRKGGWSFVVRIIIYMFLFFGKEVMNNGGGGGLLGIYTGRGVPIKGGGGGS